MGIVTTTASPQEIVSVSDSYLESSSKMYAINPETLGKNIRKLKKP